MTTTLCIEARGAPDAGGYGQVWMNGTNVKAHRLALANHQGIDLPASDVKCLHSCDNPKCVNPEHLRWGTQSENMKDVIRRNRDPKSKLTYEQRRAIHYAEGSQRSLAAEYGVSQRVVWRIKNDKVY